MLIVCIGVCLAFKTLGMSFYLPSCFTLEIVSNRRDPVLFSWVPYLACQTANGKVYSMLRFVSLASDILDGKSGRVKEKESLCTIIVVIQKGGEEMYKKIQLIS